MKAVKIYGAKDACLSIGLNDLLTLFNEKSQLYWSILFVEAIGELRDTNILEFEKMVSESKDGIQMGLHDLKVFASEIDQIINLLLIGNEKTENNIRYENDEDMYERCDFTIELVDSSYWLIHARDYRDLTLFEKIEGSTYTDE